MDLAPATTDIGTYVVRVRFEVQSKYKVFTEKTLVVEVYPEDTYLKDSYYCPTSNFPAIFYSSTKIYQWHRMDMDPTGYHFAICGRS